MTLDQATTAAIKEGKAGFDYFVSELGYEKAKELTLPDTMLKEVIRYIENYTEIIMQLISNMEDDQFKKGKKHENT